MFGAQSHVALIVNAGSVRKFMSLKIDLCFRFVLAVRELSHYFAINRTSEMLTRLGKCSSIGREYSVGKSRHPYPSSLMSRCSPQPKPSRTIQSEIFNPNISCLSMLMTKVSGSPILTFSAT